MNILLRSLLVLVPISQVNAQVVPPPPAACTSTQVPNSNFALPNSITGNVGQSVLVTCNAGYTGGGLATCQANGVFTVVTCAANSCTPTQVPGSDHAAAGSIFGTTGQVVNVICSPGFVGGGAATCLATGLFSTVAPCVGNPCTATAVPNSDHSAAGSIVGTVGQTVLVTCNAGFGGGGPATCQPSGLFTAVTCTANACTATQVANSDHSLPGSIAGTTGSLVLVTCNAGYTGGGFVPCQPTGLFSVVTCTANTCIATQVPNSDKALAGSITGTTGQIVTVTCNAGYSGGGPATCQPNGQFSAVTCAANACTATQVLNSNFALAGSLTGTTGQIVTVTCNAGYSGGGPATCQASGLFTAVTCTANPCTATQVPNSNFALAGSITGTTGQVITVTCDAGYSGGGPATCQPSGLFSAVTCTPNPCTSTAVPNSDRAAAGSIAGTTGQAVLVTCLTGFSGGGTATCLPTGLFSTVTPCTPVVCTATQVPNSDHAIAGSIVGTFGQAVPVVCDVGFTGSGTATCQASGVFTTVTCAGVPCASTQVPNSDKAAAGSVAGSTGQAVVVKCNLGYSGGGVARCQPTGLFTALSCTANPCTATAVPNSDHAAAGSIVGTTGSIVLVTCNAAFSGGGFATCQPNGLFSVAPCTGNPCTSTQVANSDHAAAGSIAGGVGQTVTVTCNAGYTGGGVATCQQGGVFSAVTPCTANACTASQVPNSDHALAGSIVGSTGQVVNVICDPGFNGGGAATCLPTGLFGVTPCTANSCTATSVPNSDKAAAGSLVGTTGQAVLVTCDAGFVGGGTATCQPTGLFTAVTPCTANTCIATQVPNSNKAAAGSIVGSTGAAVPVVCNPGYTGGGTATCLPTGLFSAVTCAANSCTPYQVANSDKAAAGSIVGTTGQTVTVTCNPGTGGGGLTTCQPNGFFTPVTCSASSCTPTQVANSDHSAVGSISGTTGQLVSIICNPGFNGGGAARCQPTGLFSNVAPCVGNPCTATSVPNSDKAAAGSITGTTGQTVLVTCNLGFNGGGVTTCQSNGLFSTVPPCGVNLCASTQVANSDRAATGSISGTTGSVVIVNCNPGFTGGGPATCQANGLFTTVACVGNTCAATQVPNSDHAVVGSIAGSTGTAVPVVCNPGYSGSGTATCLPSGLFSAVTCAANSCTRTEVANSDRAIPGSIFGSTGTTVTVTCKPGFSGGGVTTCLTSGLFSPVSCIAAPCISTSVLFSDHAALGSIAGSTGQSVMVVCNPGYGGGGLATCQPNGLFNTQPCMANRCAPTQVLNSDHALPGTIFGNFGATVPVICDPGFVGGGIATCLTTGVFTKVTCTGIPCPATQVPNSDHAAKGSIFGGVGAAVPVTCLPGFGGGGIATCTLNVPATVPPTATFSVVAPCLPVTCAPYSVPNSNFALPGSIVGTGGAAVTVVCNAGYTGGGVSTCLGTGFFSPVFCTPPTVLTGINVVTCVPTPLAPCAPPLGTMAMVTPGLLPQNVNQGFPLLQQTYLVPVFAAPVGLTYASSIVFFQTATAVAGLTDMSGDLVTFRYIQTFPASATPPRDYITSVAMFRSATALPAPVAGVYTDPATGLPLTCPLGPCEFFTGDLNAGRNVRPRADFLYIGWTTVPAPLALQNYGSNSSSPSPELPSSTTDITVTAAGSNNALYGLLAVVPLTVIVGAVIWKGARHHQQRAALETVFAMCPDDDAEQTVVVHPATPFALTQKTADTHLL